jgi:hypothetical protein
MPMLGDFLTAGQGLELAQGQERRPSALSNLTSASEGDDDLDDGVRTRAEVIVQRYQRAAILGSGQDRARHAVHHSVPLNMENLAALSSDSLGRSSGIIAFPLPPNAMGGAANTTGSKGLRSSGPEVVPGAKAHQTISTKSSWETRRVGNDGADEGEGSTSTLPSSVESTGPDGVGLGKEELLPEASSEDAQSEVSSIEEAGECGLVFGLGCWN